MTDDLETSSVQRAGPHDQKAVLERSLRDSLFSLAWSCLSRLYFSLRSSGVEIILSPEISSLTPTRTGWNAYSLCLVSTT